MPPAAQPHIRMSHAIHSHLPEIHSRVRSNHRYDATVKLWDLRAQTKEAMQTLNDAKDSIPTLVSN